MAKWLRQVSYHANFKVGRKPKIAALTGGDTHGATGTTLAPSSLVQGRTLVVYFGLLGPSRKRLFRKLSISTFDESWSHWHDWGRQVLSIESGKCETCVENYRPVLSWVSC